MDAQTTTTTTTTPPQPDVETSATSNSEVAGDKTPTPASDSNGTSSTDSTPSNPPAPADNTSPSDAPVAASSSPSSDLPTHQDIVLLEALTAALVGTAPQSLDPPSSSTHHDDDDSSVPVYSEVDPNTSALSAALSGHASPYDALLAFIHSNPAISSILALPLTKYPAPLDAFWCELLRRSIPGQHPLSSREDIPYNDRRALHRAQSRIIDAFFAAIDNADNEAVKRFVRDGLVSPDVPDASEWEVRRYPHSAHKGGRTPLIAAVQACRGDIVCTLVGLGAGVDVFGIARIPPVSRLHPGKSRTRHHMVWAPRTPLMVAATEGKLALVKLLMEDFGADDSLIAPDGQLALRLAAEYGRTEVVEYLPVRRGGAFQRWRTEHAVAVRRIVYAGQKILWFLQILLFEIPKFFVWTVPKVVVVKPLCKSVKWAWQNKHKFGGWVKKQVKEIPKKVARGARHVWHGLCLVPKILKAIAKWAWGCVKRIPKAVEKMAKWFWESTKHVGGAIWHAVMRVVSAIHTAFSAVVDYFRNITLKDVWRGIQDAARAVVVGLPKALWTVFTGFFIAVAATIVTLFGLAGELFLFFLKIILYIVQYVPKQLWHMLEALGSSFSRGWQEIMVFFNPKRI